jgi:hypothetical protein
MDSVEESASRVLMFVYLEQSDEVWRVQMLMLELHNSTSQHRNLAKFNTVDHCFIP